MNILMRYREAVAFYGLAAVVLTVIAAYPDGGTDNDGARCCVHPIPSVSPFPTTTPSSSATPGPVSTAESPSASPSPTAEPTAGPTRLPTSIVTQTVTSTPQPSISISISIPPTPTPVATPHNKAKGLKDGCLVQKKKWLLKVPCPQAHMIPEET